MGLSIPDGKGPQVLIYPNQPAAKSAKRRGILVLGMHRSGTSAMTRVLSFLGCALPRTLMQAGPGNDRGHWESQAICDFNEHLLDSAGTSWQDWLPVNPGWYTSPAYAGHLERGVALVRDEYDTVPFFVIKDPRCCRLARFWRELLDTLDLDASFVIQVRNPLEVAGSLLVRDGLDENYAHLLWLRHVLDAEYATRGRSRVFTTYPQLLKNWKGLSTRVATTLGFTWPRDSLATDQEITEFLRNEMRHHNFSDAAVSDDPAVCAWTRETYRTMRRWSEEGESATDYATLDTIRQAYDDASPTFARLIRAGSGWRHRLKETETRFAEAENLRSELQSQLERTANQLNESNRHAKELEGALTDRDHHVRTLEADREIQRDALSALTAQHDRLAGQHEVLKSELITLKQEHDRVERHREALERALADQSRTQEQLHSDLMQELNAERSRSHRMSEERFDFEQRWVAQTAAAAAAAEQVQKLRSSLDALDQEASGRLVQIEVVRADLASERTERAELETQMRSLDQDRAELGVRLAESERWVFTLSRERQRVQVELTGSQHRIAELESQITELYRDRDRAALDLEAERQRRAEFEDGVLGLKVEIGRLTEQLAESERWVYTLAEARQRAQQETVVANLRLDRLERAYSAAEDRIANAQRLLVESQSKVQVLQKERDQIIDDSARGKSESLQRINHLTQELADTKEAWRVEAVRAEAATAKAAMHLERQAEGSAEIARLVQMLKTTEDQSTQEHERHAVLERQIDDQSVELEAFKARVVDGENQLSTLRAEIASANNALAVAQKRITGMAAELADARVRLRDEAMRAEGAENEAKESGRRLQESGVEVADLVQRLRAVEGQNSILTQEKARLEERAQQQEQHLVDVRARLSRLEAQRAALLDEKNRTEEQLRERFVEIATLTSLLRENTQELQCEREQSSWLRAVYGLLTRQPRWWGLMPRTWIRQHEYRQLQQKGLFDADAYLHLYPDVAKSGMDPLRHYIEHGIPERRARG